MIGQRLHQFDLDLTAYLVGNITQYLDRPAFLADVETICSSRPLLDYLHLSHAGEEKRLVLNDDELYRLALIFEDHLNRRWSASESVHRRFVKTLPEVRNHLSRQAAEEWSDDCSRFASLLEKRQVRLSEGIGIVRGWVGRLRTLLRVMGGVELLPAPEGGSATPTCPTPESPISNTPAAESSLADVSNPAPGKTPIHPPQVETPAAIPAIDSLLVQMSTDIVEVLELLRGQQIKDYYTTEEVAQLLGKSGFTVREWCRNGRIRGEKKGSGRGKYQSWVVSHAELTRIRKEGLLPPPSPR